MVRLFMQAQESQPMPTQEGDETLSDRVPNILQDTGRQKYIIPTLVSSLHVIPR